MQNSEMLTALVVVAIILLALWWAWDNCHLGQYSKKGCPQKERFSDAEHCPPNFEYVGPDAHNNRLKKAVCLPICLPGFISDGVTCVATQPKGCSNGPLLYPNQCACDSPDYDRSSSASWMRPPGTTKCEPGLVRKNGHCCYVP